MEVIEILDGTTLASFSLRGTLGAAPPRLVGQPAGVTGDVELKDNTLMLHADLEAFAQSLGPVSGVTTICGNLDDAPCPPP